MGEKMGRRGTCLVRDGLSLASKWPACGCAGVRGVILGEGEGGAEGEGETHEGGETGNAAYGWRCSCERGLHGVRTSRGEEACSGGCVRRSLGVELAALRVGGSKSHRDKRVATVILIQRQQKRLR